MDAGGLVEIIGGIVLGTFPRCIRIFGLSVKPP